MKRLNLSFKLWVLVLTLITLGYFQLNAMPPQGGGNGIGVPITIYSSAFEHIPGLEKDADKIIETVRNQFHLYIDNMTYHRRLR